MRLLFSSTGGAGHIGPLLPLATAAHRLGHEVVVVVPERARALVPGLPTRTYPDLDEGLRAEFDASMRGEVSVEASNRAMVGELFGRLNTGWALPHLERLLTELSPDLVVREPFEPASWFAASMAGIPTVLLPCVTWHSMRAFRGDFHRGLADLAAERGVPLGDGASQGARVVVTATPAALDEGADPPETIRVRSASPPREGPSAPPLVLVTFGTVAGFLPGLLERLGEAVGEALRGGPPRAVLATGRGVDPARLGPMPDNVSVHDFVDLTAVLPQSSLTICHGGYGTSLASLAAGVPVLGLPLFSSDQWHTTEAIARAGAGRVLDTSAQSGAEIRAAVTEMLADQALLARARALASAMAAHRSPEQVVADLEARI